MARATIANSAIQAVRAFSRFYTRTIGVLRPSLYESPFSLAEVRVLYELANREGPTATELIAELDLDPGYFSRIVGAFERRGLVRKSRCATDGRRFLLFLTAQGRKAFAPLDASAQQQIEKLVHPLSPAAQSRLIEAMHTIEKLLGARVEQSNSYLLRPHQPGDMGLIVHRHGVVYSSEYGYDERYEALVATIVAEFIRKFDAKFERCWVAESDAGFAGSVFLVRASKTVARLRLLFVEPSARGLGIGTRLVAECIRFARQAGYRKITLWTQEELSAARRIYAAAGFQLVHKERHHSWSRRLVGENWDLAL